jgi:hypothetical protein
MMGTDPGTNQNENSPQHQDEPVFNEAGHGDEGSSDHGAGLAARDAMAVADDGNQGADIAMPNTETDIVAFGHGNVTGTESAGTGDFLGDDDLLGALTSMPSVGESNIEHTLDQLTTSTDLFDVPALDFHDDLPT